MKKLLILLAFCWILAPATTSYASGLPLGNTGSITDPDPGEGGTIGGDGISGTGTIPVDGPSGYIDAEFSGSVGDETISGNITGEITFPYESYIPRITRLHSVNALFADAGYSVYFLPVLDDFPSNLSKLALNTVSTVDGSRHQFAIVYDGDYDREVMYQEATSTDPKVTHYTTSKKVFSDNYNSRALNLLGYDLLLQSEEYDLKVIQQGTNLVLWADYLATPISDRQPIYARTAVMDIYKALGIYEWDIQFAFIKLDEDRYGEFDINKHPIVTQLPALTGVNSTQGVDITEMETYVAVTRTNPDLYWERAQRDCLFTSAHQEVSSEEVGVTGATGLYKTQMSTMSYLDFLTLCANMMYLYGEPVLTNSEATSVMNSLQITIPASCTKEQYAALTFLVAKGIVAKDELSGLNSDLQYSKMLNVLMRVADKGSRLTYKNEFGYMFNQGYVEVNDATIIDNVVHYSFSNTDYRDRLDYLVEKVDDVTRFYVQNHTPDTELETSVKVSTVSTDSSQLRFNSANLTYETREHYRYEYNGNWISILRSGKNDVEWLDDVTIDGKEYYHFRVNSRVFPNGISMGLWGEISADGDNTYWILNPGDDSEVAYPHSTITPYRLNGGGGVFKYENGSLRQYSFDAVPVKGETVRLDLEYMDSTRIQKFNGSAQLSNEIQMDVFLVYENMNPSNLPIVTDGEDTYNYRNLCNTSGFREGNGFVICPGKMFANVINHSDDGYWQIEFQTYTNATDTRPTDHNPFQNYATMSDMKGFYRNLDGTLLVSLQSLLDKGIVNFYTTFDSGYVLTLSETSTVVTLCQGSDRNYAYIGETMLMLPDDEVLYEVVDNEIYINYKACTGWASDYVAVYNKDYVTYYAEELKTRTLDTTYKLPFSTSGSMKFVSKYDTQQASGYGSNPVAGFPVSMMSSNPLSNYLLVQQTDASYSDVLFVVRMSGSSGLSGSSSLGDCQGVKEHLTGDEAKNLFAKVTRGLDYTPPEYCELHAYVLDDKFGSTWTNTADVIMKSTRASNNVVSTQYNRSDDIKRVLGYTYYLRWNASLYTTSSYNEGLLAYYTSSTKRLIPMAGWYKTGIANAVNLNMNRVKLSNVDAMQKVGVFPKYSMNSLNSAEGPKLRLHEVKVIAGGGVDYIMTSSEELQDGYSIVPAPTGCFAQLRGLPYLSSDSIDKTMATDLFFYGSVIVSKQKTEDGWKLNDYTVDLSDVDWYCISYSPFGSIYTAVTSDFGQVTASYQKNYDTLSSAVGDRTVQFDWEKYTFSRMIDDMDRWSSVLLIAILNFLPRIGIFFFLILILLGLAAHMKFMQVFCHRVFDIYEVLTFKHMNVDNCDAKKLVLTSIFALGIFSMIMDGLIIQIVTFVCNAFVELIHR